MHVADVGPTDVRAELSNCLYEGDDLHVADGAADLDQDHVDVLGGQAPDPLLDLVGHVRDDLNGLAEVVAAALLRDDRGVDRPRRRVRVPIQALVDEALVVPEVEVGLSPVIGHEDLAVLARVHGPRVDVDVGVELAHRDSKATLLEEATERRGRQALSERGGHPTCHEDELAHAAGWGSRALTGTTG